MGKFIKNVLIFFLPIILLGSSMEILLRRIPNDYAYKANYLDENSKNIKVLFLGSSHAYYGINPNYIPENSFNASYVSQSLSYDYEILEKYRNRLDSLEYIVIPISYFSLFFDLGSSSESWRTKNYSLYYGITSSNISDYFELLSNKTDINVERIKLYYWLGQTNISCSELGWGLGFNLKNRSKSRQDLIESGQVAAERHYTVSSETNLSGNLDILNEFIQYASEKSVQIIFYTPPAYYSYIENLNKIQLDYTITTMTQLDEKYQNVNYVNYLNDTSFTEIDFFNADHLDELGAEKLTKKIGELLIFK